METDIKRDAVKYVLLRMGYEFFDISLPKDITTTIIELLKLKDGRLAKAIPFIFYKSVPSDISQNTHVINLAKLEKLAKREDILEELDTICFITLEIFKQTSLAPLWQEKLLEYVSREDKTSKITFLIKIYNLQQAPSQALSLSSHKMENFRNKISYLLIGLRDYIDEFEMQRKMEESTTKLGLIDTISKEQETLTRLAMAKLFTPKQLEIIYKVMNGIKLNRTDYVYYFQTIKKRLDAIRKAYNLAGIVLEKKPRKE